MQFKQIVAIAIAGAPALLLAADRYIIQAAVDDEKFVIDGEVYAAQTYCFGWDEGDAVIFVDGTPGACATATLYNVNKETTCKVWCE